MAKNSPSIRVNLSLPPEVVAVVDRMASVTGTGRSTVVRELLCDALPMFEQLADALESAHMGNRQALELVADTVQQVAADVVGQAADLRIAIRGRRAPRIKRARRD